MERIAAALLGWSPEVRYVATYRQGRLSTSARQDLKNASAAESDRYEELLVNPTLLCLLSQRGNIDCGGLAYVVVRYGNFYQLVRPLPDGRVSVALDSDTNLDATIRDVKAILVVGIAS